MCLATPGRIVQINKSNDPMNSKGLVDFAGISREISLAYVPEAQVGDYVIVHAGLALSLLDEHEARESLSAIQQLQTK